MEHQNESLLSLLTNRNMARWKPQNNHLILRFLKDSGKNVLTFFNTNRSWGDTKQTTSFWTNLYPPTHSQLQASWKNCHFSTLHFHFRDPGGASARCLAVIVCIEEQKWDEKQIIRLMENTLHHLGCPKCWVLHQYQRPFGASTSGAGFLSINRISFWYIITNSNAL